MGKFIQTRRQLLVRGAATLGALTLSGAQTASAKADRVVFADFGGTTRRVREEIFFAPFTERTGVKVVSADADLARFKFMAERGRSQWDAADVNGGEVALMATQSLLTPLPSGIARSDFVPAEWQDYATAGFANCFCIGYNTEQNSGAPSSWKDFFDLAKFPGRRGLPRTYFGPAVVEAALLADGVELKDLYPLDYKRAFQKLDSIRDSVLFYQDHASGQQALHQGSVRMSILVSGRVDQLKQSGSPVDIAWEQAFVYPWSGAAVPKGAPNGDAIFELLDSMMKPEVQAEFAKRTGYGPALSAAFDHLDADTRKRLPNAPEHAGQVINMDLVYYSKIRDEYMKAYLDWLGA